MIVMAGWGLILAGIAYYLIVSVRYELLLKKKFPDCGVEVAAGRTRYFHPLQMGRWNLERFTEAELTYLRKVRGVTGPAISLVWAGAAAVLIGSFLPF